MRKFILILLTLCLVIGFNPQQAIAASPTTAKVEVSWISDADTFRIKLPQGIITNYRLACIDAPEVPHTIFSKKSQLPELVSQFKWGELARNYVKQIMPIKTIVDIAVTSIDYHYGRTVGLVYSADGETIQEKLIKAGLAQTYYLSTCPIAESLLKAELIAKESRIGIWGDSTYVSPDKARKIASGLTSSTLPTSTTASKLPATSDDSASTDIAPAPSCLSGRCRCKDFPSRESAAAAFKTYPELKYLDRDKDGIPCE